MESELGSQVKLGHLVTTNGKHSDFPLLIEANGDVSLHEWLGEHKNYFEHLLMQSAGVLLRGFGLYSISQFNQVVQSICPDLLDYVYRSTPRTKLGGRIYTATEYPANRVIPMHNENSYSRNWPNKIFFFAVVVADQGGETPIADSRRVYQAIAQAVREKFESKGVLYVRNFTPGIDLSWQEVFQTQKQEDVERFCLEQGIEVSWNNEGPELTTRQICQATHLHPVTKEKVWFNQAHLFHASSLPSEDRQSLLGALGDNSLPRNAFYGDGEPIEEDVLNHIREVYENEKIRFKWQRGDIMVLDNVLAAHGREIFSGERKVAVAMA